LFVIFFRRQQDAPDGEVERGRLNFRIPSSNIGPDIRSKRRQLCLGWRDEVAKISVNQDSHFIPLLH